MAPVPGRPDETGQQPAAPGEGAAHPERAAAKASNGHGAADERSNGAASNGNGVAQKHAEKTADPTADSAADSTDKHATESAAGPAIDSAVNHAADQVTDTATEPVADSVADSATGPTPEGKCEPEGEPAPVATEPPAVSGEPPAVSGEQPAASPAAAQDDTSENGTKSGRPAGDEPEVSPSPESKPTAAVPAPEDTNGAGKAPPPPPSDAQDETAEQAVTVEQNGAQKTETPAPGDEKKTEESDERKHKAAEANGNENNTDASTNGGAAHTNQSHVEMIQDSVTSDKDTQTDTPADGEGLKSDANLKPGDNHEPLELPRDREDVSAPAPTTTVCAVGSADAGSKDVGSADVASANSSADAGSADAASADVGSAPTLAEPPAVVSHSAASSATGTRPKSPRKPPISPPSAGKASPSARTTPPPSAGKTSPPPSAREARSQTPQQQQPSGPDSPAKTGMTETRSIWVVGSEENLPGAVGGEEAGAAAASWVTVHSTVRAIRVFKRGVSKRLRRPPSQIPAAAAATPPRPSASASRQLSQPADGATPESAGGKFFRSLSFRRSNSWRGPLRRNQTQTGASAAATPLPSALPSSSGFTASSGAGDVLQAAMQQSAAGAVPLQPHVQRAAFSEACAAYEPPLKKAAPIADQPARDKKEAQLKEELRSSYYPLDHPSRHQLWSNICQMHGASLGQNEEYESTVRQLEGELGPARRGQHQIPPFVHSFYMNSYALNDLGVWTAERVLAVLYYNNPTITYAPSLYPTCCLMLHYMDEADTYNALNMMLRNKKQGYLVQTKRDFEISWKILIKLCKKHAKTSLHFLQQEARSGENVDHVLADWLAWLFCFLPLAHAVRLMDCYLMEGEKVLYRGAMALVLLVHKMATHHLGEWAYSFKEFTVQEVMEKFCTNMQLAPEKLLKTMFGIRGFSRETLTATFTKVKAQIKAGGGRLNFPERRCTRAFSKQQSHVGMPSVLSQDELAEASSTIGVKELLRLWENLPARYALYTPLLIYTTDEHGFSLKTFYQKVDRFEPTVLLLRTTEGAVFGAYCSVTWTMRNESQEDGTRQRYFGTGETFLFTLRPQLKVYPWVGKVRQAADPQLAGLSHSEQLFMAADNTMVTIGGGGGQAIWLDENLSRGKTDACQTFANPPLTPSGSFEVACMEAFAFSPA